MGGPGGCNIYTLQGTVYPFHSKSSQGSIAKKPYNPIIGEIFNCAWNVDTRNGARPQCIAPNQVGDVTFLAEQVSHHPPSKYLPLIPPTSAHPPPLLSNICSPPTSAHPHPLNICSPSLTSAPYPQHPPPSVSAFYAECKDKKICANYSVWTKSKFLGISVGVDMVGVGGSTQRTFHILKFHLF